MNEYVKMAVYYDSPVGYLFANKKHSNLFTLVNVYRKARRKKGTYKYLFNVY